MASYRLRTLLVCGFILLGAGGAAAAGLAGADRDGDGRIGEATAIRERARLYLARHGISGASDMLARVRWSAERWRAKGWGRPDRTSVGPGFVNLGPVNGAGRCPAVAPHPTVPGTLLAGAAGGGVWRSTDDAASWVPLTDDLADLSVGAVAYAPSNPEVVYLGSGEGGLAIDFIPGIGLLRSDDGGDSWYLPDTSGSVVASQFYALAVDPDDPDVLLAATNRGLLATDDGGATWEVRLADPGLIAVTEVVRAPTDPDRLYAATWCQTACPPGVDRIMRSDDRGLSWQPASTGMPMVAVAAPELNRTAVTVAAFDRELLYAAFNVTETIDGVPATKIYRSLDGGVSWHDTGYEGYYLGFQGWYDNAITISPHDPAVIVAAGVWYVVSHDAGQTWTERNPYEEGDGLGTDTLPHVDGHDLQWQGTRLWLGCDGGMWYSDDGGLTWTGRNDGLVTRQYYSLALDPARPARVLGGTQDNGTGLRRDDDDDQWDVVLESDGFDCAVNPILPDIAYGTMPTTLIFRSLRGGLGDWVEISPAIGNDNAPFLTPLEMRADDPAVLYTGSTRVWRSADGGDSWSALPRAVSNGGWSGDLVWAIGSTPADPEALLVGKGSEVYASRDGGATWSVIRVGRIVTNVALSPHDPRLGLACLVAPAAGEDNLLRTTDGGFSWRPAGAGLPPFAVQVAQWHPQDPDLVYAGTDVGLYLSSDGGRSWSEHGDGLPAASVHDLEVSRDGGRLVVATHGRGVWQLELERPENQPPVVGLSGLEDGATVLLGDLVTFSATAVDPDGDRVRARWLATDDWRTVDGGEGAGALETSLSHRFLRPGELLLGVNVTDERGGVGFDRLRLHAVEPADACESPRVLPGAGPFPWLLLTENAGAGEDPRDPVPPCLAPSDLDDDPLAGRWGTLWFEFTPAQSGRYSLATCGSTADTVLSAWTGPPCGPWEPVEGACNDDDVYLHCSGRRTDSYLELELAAGSTTRFAIGSFSQRRQGPIRLALDCLTCGPPPPRETTVLVPAAAHVTGFGGARWVTDLALANRGVDAVTAELTLFGEDGAAAAGPSVTVEIPPRTTTMLEDVVAVTLGATGSGALRIAADGMLVVGSYGQGVPGWPIDRVVEAGGAVRLVGLRGGPSFRSNLGLANAAALPVQAQVDLYDDDATKIGSARRELPPWGRVQLDRVLDGLPIAGDDPAIAIVRNLSLDGRLAAYASVVDQRTGDPTFIAGSPLVAAGQPQWIPAVAHTDGLAGTIWRTDLELANIGSYDLLVTLELFKGEGAPGGPWREVLRIQSDRVARLTDVVRSVLGTDGAGALRLEVDRGQLAVTSRTANDGGFGTFGQGIPTTPEAEALGGDRIGLLLPLAQSAAFRSNLGLVNLGASAITVVASFEAADGAVLGAASYLLGARSWRQVTAAAPRGTVLARVASEDPGARFLAYASVVDNHTGDPTYVPAQLDPGTD